ncbi:hypothetical protein M8J77_019575 [Diaphorina citri]|nr:hypothetical protein M8J77_019575 [Diaphorina citri]
MAQLITIKLSRYDSTPWGFRLQGGKDFGTPLVIQKVNGGSLAEKAGLQVGDALIKVNNTDVSGLKHKDAQDVIVRSGNSFEFTIQRGGVVTTTWKPSVTPVGHVPSPAGVKSPTPALVTKTSLAYKGPPPTKIGSAHNVSPHPFSSSVNGHDGKQLVNKQYNSPVGIYSEESIAETLSAQAEVLAGGVLGVNFKKNEKNYTPANSEVLKMVQEADQEPRSPEPDENRNSLPPLGNSISSPTSGVRHVQAPTTPASLPPGQNICADCERLIVGVFVRIKDKNLHVECFKCATCGTSLKNVGYYNINNKLYCDVHAKMVARQNPPGPGLEPVTVPFGKKPPANTISAALTTHTTAPKSPVSPTYQAPSSLPPYSPSSPALSGAKPYGTQNTIKSTSGVNFGSPIKPVQSPYSPKPVQNTYSPKPIQNTYSPKPAQSPLPKPKNVFKEEIKSSISNGQTIGNNTNSAFAPVTKSQTETKLNDVSPKVEELSPDKKALAKLTETIGSTCLLKSIIEAEKRPSTPVSKPEKKEEVFLPPAPRREDQGIFDYAANMRPYYTRSSPVPHAEVLPSPHQVPHDTRSLLPPASLVRPLSPDVTISFPPVFPVLPGKPRSRCTSPTPAQNVSSQSEPKVETTPTKAPPALTRSPPKESKENYNELENIPAITVAPEHVYELPKYHETPGLMAQAMTTAPITPFNPVPFPEPIEIPSMKPLPPETKPVLIRPESPMLNALTVAPDRSYSPLPSVTKPLDTLTKLTDINKPVNILLGDKEEKPKKEPPCYSMLSALTIASDRPYSPLPAPPPPAPTPVVHVITDAPFETYVPKIPGSQQADSKSQAKGSDKIHKSGDEIGGDITHSHQFPLTSSGLHIPATIPHYQEHIDECDIHTKLRNSPLLIKTAAQESVSIQSKIMNILSQQETSSVKTTAISAEPLKSSALDFLKQKDDTAKIIPTLGYKPNSLLDSTKSITQTTQKEGTQIVHEEISATVSEKTSSSITKSSYEQVESSTQLTQEKVCQQVCQSQCPPSQCLKTKQTIQESVQKSEPKPIFEPKVKFERQNTFEPKSDVITPKYNGNTTSTAPTVSSELSRKLSSLIPSMPSDPNPSSLPSNTGSGAGGKGGSSGLTTAPRRGRGVLNPQNLAPGARVPLCGQCYQQIRGPFITALGKIWCPDHFLCVRPQCKRPLQDIGFVEEDSGLYCEFCFEQYLAPVCHKCSHKIKGDCLNAIGKHYHPECFTCAYCGKLFGNNPFFLEEGLPYCENDWNDLFTTKCFACGFPIEAGDRWVEALNNNYHSLCFNCSVPSCKKNLEGQSFFAKAGRPFCKAHAR